MSGELEAGMAALLLMDFQNYGAHPNGYWAKCDPEFFARVARSGVVARVARALGAARRSGMRIVHIANRWRPGHTDMHEGMPIWAGRKGTDVAVEGT